MQTENLTASPDQGLHLRGETQAILQRAPMAQQDRCTGVHHNTPLAARLEKYHPRKQLLAESEQRMTARAFGAYWWICNKLMIERLPGIIKWDEGRLMEWGRLSAAEWKKNLQLILPAFEFHEATNTLHHPTIKSGYAEQYRQVMTHRAFGKIGAAKRYGRAKKSPPHKSPHRLPIRQLQRADYQNYRRKFSGSA